MFFSRALFSLLAVGAIGALASPAPVVEKREDVSDVLAVVGNLKATTDVILPQIDSLVDSGAATDANLSPLLQDLATALDTSSSELDSLKGKVDPNTGGTKDEVAQEVSVVYTDVTKSLNNLKTKKPHLWYLIPKFGLEAALIKLLLGLELVLAGVLTLVAGLLKLVGGLLTGIGFVLLKLVLGLH
ncbi:hypothetical protein CVT24_007082 [Panaeolus cyanescens]|uniref:Uncharacterized protein n=1 Tax=Panaeolus cyanescens TaxID=181874 RepID=A0A409YP56_9AGAR|nr:hypothetical protein CVT24_007082 [Panaeolus cyanescens]